MIVKKMKPSHLPILKAVMEILQPTSCVECGSGDYSTALLSAIPDFVSIEHDAGWAEKAQDLYGADRIMHIPLDSDIKYSTFPKKITKSQRTAIKQIYAELAMECDLLFVDSWACLRDIALRAFSGKFKIAVLHDTQEPRYGFGKVVRDMLDVGYVRVECIVKRGAQPHTDIIFSPASSVDRIDRTIEAVKGIDQNIKFRITQ